MQIHWQKTSEPFDDGSVISQDQCVDLAIIGGGFTGCSAALKAAEMGAKVALFDAETVGYGGSGRNVGLVNAGLWLPPAQVERQLGRSAGQELNAALAAAPDLVFGLAEKYGIDCETTRNGTLHCAHNSKGLKDLERRYAQQRDRGAPVTLESATRTQALTGSAGFLGALRDDRAGTLQPLAYVRGLARAASTLGAKIYEKSCITKIDQRADHWQLHCNGHRVKAAKLLLATGAYTQGSTKPTMPQTALLNFFQLATEPLPKALREKILPGGEGCWDTGLVMRSFRIDRRGHFLFGSMGLPDSLGLHQSWARRSLKSLFPDLSGLEVTSFWSGRIAMPQDHIPKILRFGRQGAGITGYSGRGIAPGTVFGQALAESLLTDDETCLPLKPQNSFRDRLPKTRSIYYELGARAVHLIDR